MNGNLDINIDLHGTITVDGTLNGTITAGGGGGGEDTLNTLFNTPAGATPTPFTMSDDNENHTCYGFLNGLDVTLDENVKTIATNAFDRCVGLKSITGAGVESISSRAFSNAVYLTSASFAKCKTVGEGAFNSCGLVNISFPNLLTVAKEAFMECGSLVNIDLPACTFVGEDAFSNCRSVSSINLPSCVNVSKNAFGGQYTSINLPVCTTVGESALRDFKGQVLRLPAVQTMGREQFRSCENLTDLYLGFDGVVAVTREEEFFDWEMFPWSGPMTITVHVPAGQLAGYQADSVWQEIVTAAASDNVTVTFVGDYEV